MSVVWFVGRSRSLFATALLALVGCGSAPSGAAATPPAPPVAVATANVAIDGEAPPQNTAAIPTAETGASPAPSASTNPTPAPEEVRVTVLRPKGDRRILVVPGETKTAIVYLHGRCGDPTAFEAWAAAGRKFGTVLSLEGDVKCKNGRTKWSGDIVRLDARINAAMALARTELGLEIDDAPRVVVGYSQGSLRAESLATRFPKRYPRAVLIAGPRAPKPTSLGSTEAVLFLVGDHDVRGPLRDAALKLQAHGRNARYLELRDARHGDYGSSPLPTVTEGFEWLFHTPSSLGS